MIRLFFVLIVSTLNYGFLLEPQNQNGGGQYLTVSEFYNQVKQQQQNLEHVRLETTQLHSENVQLRQYTDKSLETLASQIQQRFSDMENKMNENCKCNATSVDNEKLEKRYKAMEDNNTKLQVQFDELLKKYRGLQKEHMMLKSKDTELESHLQLTRQSLNEATVQIKRNENKTATNEKQIADLMSLKTLQPLLDIKNVKDQVNTLNTQLHTLSVSEQAKIQDFMALYNITMASKHDVTGLMTNQTLITSNFESQLRNLDNKLSSIDRLFNSSFEVLAKDISNLRDHDKKANEMMDVLQHRIDETSEKVALTACPSTGKYYSTGSIILFDDIKTQTGITNVLSFNSTGKFVCTRPGLYQVSVTLVANDYNYAIYKNGNSFVHTYVSSRASIEIGSFIVSMDLVVNDEVWITPLQNGFFVYSAYSCITIVKIK